MDDVLKARVEMRDMRLDRHAEPGSQVTSPEDQVNDMVTSRGEEDEDADRPTAQDIDEPQRDFSETLAPETGIENSAGKAKAMAPETGVLFQHSWTVDGHDQRDQNETIVSTESERGSAGSS